MNPALKSTTVTWPFHNHDSLGLFEVEPLMPDRIMIEVINEVKVSFRLFLVCKKKLKIQSLIQTTQILPSIIIIISSPDWDRERERDTKTQRTRKLIIISTSIIGSTAKGHRHQISIHSRFIHLLSLSLSLSEPLSEIYISSNAQFFSVIVRARSCFQLKVSIFVSIIFIVEK